VNARLVVSLLGALGAGCASGRGAPPALDFAASRPAGILEGAWVGGTNVLGAYTLVEAAFARAGGGLSGELRVPSENVSRLPVTSADVTGAAVRFAFRSPFGSHDAVGRWDGGMIFGRIEGGGLSGEFHLLPVRPPDPVVSRSRAGSYGARTGHHLLVTPRADGNLAWAESEPLADGAVWIAGGALYGYAVDTVFSDRSIRAEPRVHEWAVFRTREIEWHPETSPARVTRRLEREVVQEAVTFSNGAVTLAGTLLLPAGAGPHPGAVLVHGSGPAERAGQLSLLRAELLLRRGIAVLLYDKRGVGASSGDWEQAGIDELAGDAAAAVTLLRAHAAIERGAVGLVGHSQAGWVMPAAATRASGADFLVVLSGGGVSPREQEIFRARAEAADAGWSDDAASLMESKWQYAATRADADWNAYVARVRAAEPALVALVEAPLDRDPARWALVRALARYDPLPDLGALRVPTLVVFGSDDDNVPVARAAAVWRDALPASLLTIETVPGVGHALIGLREGRGSIFPAPFVRALGAWLDTRPWAAVRP
jgi:pimeloyl-ACP methyl ester carboxylesterase